MTTRTKWIFRIMAGVAALVIVTALVVLVVKAVKGQDQQTPAVADDRPVQQHFAYQVTRKSPDGVEESQSYTAEALRTLEARRAEEEEVSFEGFKDRFFNRSSTPVPASANPASDIIIQLVPDTTVEQLGAAANVHSSPLSAVSEQLGEVNAGLKENLALQKDLEERFEIVRDRVDHHISDPIPTP